MYSSLIANIVFNAFLSYTAITLNIITIHALRKTSSLPKNLRTLLLSVAVSDLGVGCVVQPLFTVTLVKDSLQHSISYDDTSDIIGKCFILTSFFGVTALSADRFLSVHLHLRYQELVPHKRVVVVVISFWVFSTFLSLTKTWIEVNIDMIFAIIIASCLFATTLLNYKIFVAMRRHKNQIQSLQGQQGSQNGELVNVARLRKFVAGTFILYLVFLLCYLPRLCTLVVTIISGTSNALKRSSLYSTTLVFLNSSLNPLIYCWKLRHIRHTVIKILRNIMRRNQVNQVNRSHVTSTVIYAAS